MSDESVVTFTGLVHPQGGAWTLHSMRTIQVNERQFDITLRDSVFNVRVSIGDESIEFTGDEAADSAVLFELWGDTETVLRGVLDSLGFQLGGRLEPQFTTGTIGLRAATGLRSTIPTLGRVTENVVPGDLLDRFVEVASSNANVRHALADYRSALALSDDCAFYCYRAIESIRQEFVVGEDVKAARRQSWPDMREALGVDSDELRELETLAVPRRHGANTPLTVDQRFQWLLWTRDKIAMYVENVL